jgi:hypothetical protein
VNPRRVAPWHWNWKWRITDNEWRAAAWDRAAPLIVALLLVTTLGGIGYGVWEGHQSAHSSSTAAYFATQDNGLSKKLIKVGKIHHKENAAQNARITALLKESNTLLKEHSGSFAQQTAFELDSTALAAELVTCAKAGFGSKECADLPNIPLPTIP